MAISADDLAALWDWADPAASEARFAAAAVATSDENVRAELLTQQARALGLQDRFAEAEALLDAIGDGVAIVDARVALERGRVRNSSGDPAAAIPLFEQAARIADLANALGLHLDALHMLAIADPGRVHDWTGQALKLLAGTMDRDLLRWHIPLRNNLGWALFDAGRFGDALTQFELARDAAARWGSARQVELADAALDECRAALGQSGEVGG